MSWLSNPNTPAWVQAIGSIGAIVGSIIGSVWLQNRQRRISNIDAAGELAAQEQTQLRRLMAGLRAEIKAAIEQSSRHEQVISTVLVDLARARAEGKEIVRRPIQPGSMKITDGVVYRQLAAELGRLPIPLIEATVSYYARTFEIERIADSAPSAEEAYANVKGLMPRARMAAAMLIRTLEKFERAGFNPDTLAALTQDEIREIASEVSYPLEKLLRERGLSN